MGRRSHTESQGSWDDLSVGVPERGKGVRVVFQKTMVGNFAELFKDTNPQNQESPNILHFNIVKLQNTEKENYSFYLFICQIGCVFYIIITLYHMQMTIGHLFLIYSQVNLQ